MEARSHFQHWHIRNHGECKIRIYIPPRFLCALDTLAARTYTFSFSIRAFQGQRDVVIWSKIPHKTSLQGGPFGWPDPLYFTTCNASLDGLQVPGPRDTVSKECISYFAPQSLSSSDAISSALRPPPTATTDGNCAICFDSLAHGHGRLECIQGCNHVFHGHCIERSLSLEPKCPMCRQPVGDPQGRSPSGTMSIELTAKDFSGAASTSTSKKDKVKAISITYYIPSGTQLSYHENPGTSYEGTTRVAYLPDSADGRSLLTRLKYAWTHGLTFRVGTSLTSGQHNQVTWTSIHHKTCLQGGPYGFPDANYITNCNGSLDALFVPDADS
jgi:deltex-like protein